MIPDHAAALPPNERQRLETLRLLEVLDTLPEQAYDDLTLLASRICGTPISILALIDADRQWYKSTIGTPLKESPRNIAFCAHALLQPDDILTIEDAHADPRFAGNPFVVGEPHIRFYAGVPIVMSGGEAIGTLCVIDTKPRRLGESEAQCLRALGRQAASLFELRAEAMAAERLASENEKTTVEARLKQKRGMELLELVLRGGQMGLWDLHVPSGVWTVNAREQMMLGYASVTAGAPLDWRTLIHPDDWSPLADAMEPHLNGRASFYESTHRMRHADGHYIWVLDRGVIVERNVRGEALRIVGTHSDVTDQKQRAEADRLNAERLELALSGGDHGLWDWHVPSGKVIRNRPWLNRAGNPDDSGRVDDIDALWKLIAFDEDRERGQVAMRRHLVGLTPMFDVEMRVRHRDGRVVWVSYRAKVFERDADGRALRVVGTSMNITTRKTDELALQSTRDLLERTGRLARIGGWSVDVADDSVTWSDEVYRLHDLNPAERPDLRQTVDFYTPESRARVAAAIERCRTDGTPWDLEVSLVTARGRAAWIRSIGRAETEGGAIVRIVGTAQDITDLKVAEQRRIASDRQMRLMADNLPALITRLDRDQRYTFVNSEVERVFDIDRSTMIGKTMREVRTIREGLSYETIASRIEAVLAGSRVVFEGYTEVRGRPYYYQAHYEPDIDETGTVNGFFTMTVDITERKRAEMQRAESEERLRGITDHLPMLIAEFDRRGHFRFANETWRTWLDIDPKTVVGMPMTAASGIACSDARRTALRRALAGEQVSFDEIVELPVGARCLQTTYLPHRDATGQVAGIYALIEDITALKEAQVQRDRLALAIVTAN